MIKGKIDQIAFVVRNDEQEAFIKKVYSLNDKPDTEDFVTSTTKVIGIDQRHEDGETGFNVAHLKFWYQHGMEFEILRYVQGANWHQDDDRLDLAPVLSHHGIHLADDCEMPDLEMECSLKLVQENFTVSHTSAYLTRPGPGFGRKYQYRIYRLPDGNYLKLIKRIKSGFETKPIAEECMPSSHER